MMKLVQTILRDVVEDKILLDQGDLAVALLGLAEAFNTVAGELPGFVEITHQSTGKDLKGAILSLPLKHQMPLLHLFSQTVASVVTRPAPLEITAGEPTLGPIPQVCEPAAPWDGIDRRRKHLEEEEKRKLKTWLIKATFIFIAPIPCILVGAVVAIGVRSGTVPDGPVVNSIMSTATEILKLIFAAS